MAVLMPNGKQQFFYTNGLPLVGGKVFTYAAGTTTPQATFSDSAGAVPNSNPIILDSRGEALVYWSGAYKVVLQDALGNTLYTVDNYVTDPAAIAAAALAASNAAAALAASNAILQSSTGASLVGFQGVGSTTLRTTQDKLREIVSTKDFGAIGDGIADDTAALASFFAAAKASGRGRIIKGVYRITSAVNWDLTSVAVAGVVIEGDGENNTIIDVSTVATSPAFFIGATGSTACFYSSFKGFAIRGGVAGTVFRLGKPDFSDAMNEFIMSLIVNNNSASPLNVATEINYVLNSDIRLVSNCSGRGNGDAVQLRQATFNTFSGSWSNAKNSAHITAGYNYGNVFLSPDYEVSSVGVLIDTATGVNNTFIGGQWENNVNAINATAGSNNRFVGPNFAYANPVAGSVGVRVTNSGYGAETFASVNCIPVGAFDAAFSADALATQSASVILKKAGFNAWSISRDTSGNLLFNRYNQTTGAMIDVSAYIEPTQGVFTINKLSVPAVGFFGAGVISARPSVTGSRGVETAAAASLRAALVSLGLVSDNTTA